MLLAPPSDMRLDPSLIVPYLMSNAVALVIVLAAARAPRLVRWCIVAAFAIAALYNARTATVDPESYLGFARGALPPYPWLIENVFALAPRGFVLLIAAVQLTGALLIALPSRAAQRVGAGLLIAFLVAIAPFGLGSAFPSSLLFAAAVWLAVLRETGERAILARHG